MNIHIIGIKGWGTSALAQILKSRGNNVCGSDVPDVMPSDRVLQSANIHVESFDTSVITSNVDRVIYSTGYDLKHPQILKSKELGIPLASYPEAVGELFNDRYGISVCGTHGKTTSSALLAYVLENLGADPTAIIGSYVEQLGSNARIGLSDYFVLETDEYQNKLQYYHPKAILLTSVEWDHPDFFSSKEEYRTAFRTFCAQDDIGHIVACIDDEGVRDAIASASVKPHTYGESEDAEYRMTQYRVEGENTLFSIMHGVNVVGECSLNLIGKHNALNALGVIVLCDVLGIGSVTDITRAITAFKGTQRRFEYRGSKGAVKVYVDYGHHPTEVRVTLQAIRERFTKARLWCVFGPHTFSRTHALLDDFANSFGSADHVLVLDIYGARETKGDIHARDLTSAINAISHNAEYAGSIDGVIDMLNHANGEIDILVCMGASEDVWKVAEQFLQS